MSGERVDIKPGNALPLKNIPLGTLVHNVEMKPGKGAQLIRSAGSAGQLMAKEGKYAHIKMPSGEVRLIQLNCYATVGQVGNLDHEKVSIGKAGTDPLAGTESPGSGSGHEPGRPSSGRRRREIFGRPAPGDSLGSSHEGV